MHYNWHIMVAMILIPNFKKYYTKNLQWASEFLTLQNFDYHSTWHCFPVLKFTKKYSSIWIVNWLHARYVQFLKKLYWTGVDPSRSELCIIICNLVEMYAEFGHKFSQLSKEITHSQVREHPLMMSDFMGGSKMTPQNRTLEDKNRALGGRRVKNDQKKIEHHLWMFP